MFWSKKAIRRYKFLYYLFYISFNETNLETFKTRCMEASFITCEDVLTAFFPRIDNRQWAGHWILHNTKHFSIAFWIYNSEVRIRQLLMSKLLSNIIGSNSFLSIAYHNWLKVQISYNFKKPLQTQSHLFWRYLTRITNKYLSLNDVHTALLTFNIASLNNNTC